MNQLIWGALAMSAGIASLFFLRFWTLSRDRLFIFFCLAFLMLAINWLGLALVRSVAESRHEIMLLRLAAFALIIAGVIDKNRRARAPQGTAHSARSNPPSVLPADYD